MAQTADAHELEYRQRLQRALGDDFELRDLIGRGGFGSVYAAWDRKLEREVAVKALRHDLFPTRLVLERFQREAKAVAKLRDPHILPVYAVGEGDGIAYMMMPLIRGESLKDVMQSGARLATPDAVRIASEVARALGAAHRVGIVHRDVKPENILLEGDNRHALLADFGIAKALQAEGEMTGSGVVIGSPQYMSPEQAGGERDIDARSDIYSLGAVTYEMLAGRRPYEADNFQQLLVRQLTTEPPHLATLVPGVPREVADAVMRALARDRTQRWTSASDFAAALALAPVRFTVYSESWLGRRGPLLIALLLLVYYLDVTEAVLLRGSPPEAMRRAIQLFSIPLGFLFRLGLLLLLVNFIGTLVRTRRLTRSWRAVARELFGQPRWWQTWYPRGLRHPASVWNRMSIEVKVMRTFLWLTLMSLPLVFPVIFIVPSLAAMSAALAIALPLPLRFTVVLVDALRYFLVGGMIATVIDILYVALRFRISPWKVFQLLLTWDRDNWKTLGGERLLK